MVSPTLITLSFSLSLVIIPTYVCLSHSPTPILGLNATTIPFQPNTPINNNSYMNLTKITAPLFYRSIYKEPINAPSLSQSHGRYATTIAVGTPPQLVTFIVDMGSHVTWFQCAPCIGCPEQKFPMFDRSKTNTAKEISCSDPICKNLESIRTCETYKLPFCKYEAIYGDGSTSVGYLKSEIVTLSKDAKYRVDVGFGEANTGNLEEYGGILGLGAGPLAFPTQIGAESFSFCLVEAGSLERSTLTFSFDSSKGGGETFGEDVVTAHLVHSPQYPYFHFVEGLTGISVGGKMLEGVTQLDFSMERGGVIIDTGSSSTVLPQKVLEALKEALFVDKFISQFPRRFYAHYHNVLNACFELKNFDFSAKSPIELHIGDQKLDFPWKNIFARMEDFGEAVYCLMFDMKEEEEGILPGPSILGNTLFQNTRLTYDLKNSIVAIHKNQC